MLVRAFFGTTKYCNHFLNNFRCFNSDKCMFLHEIADPNDIITEDTKFGYSEHIKLAKKIIGFGSIQSQMYVRNNANKNRTVLPTISTIYQKNDIIIKTQNHRRKKSNEKRKVHQIVFIVILLMIVIIIIMKIIIIKKFLFILY